MDKREMCEQDDEVERAKVKEKMRWSGDKEDDGWRGWVM